MGCAVSCVHRTTMALFGKHTSSTTDARSKLERKLYLAKESPESDFDLSDCELHRVPSGIYSICKVYRKEHLFLHNNNLTSLHGGGQLSDLYIVKILNLNNNKFTYLPNEIKYLINLTELQIQDNYLRIIPDEIEYLNNLQFLNISNNQLIKLTPSLGKLKKLRKLDLTGNRRLDKLCPELCSASNLTQLLIDVDDFVFPPIEITSKGTEEIMKFLCDHMNVEYYPPTTMDSETIEVQNPKPYRDPFVKQSSITWEEHEAAMIEQEIKIHEASKQQKEKFLTKILQEQTELDVEIAKIQEAKDVERQRLIKVIQDDEKDIECLVKNFIQSDNLKPEIIQQQLAYEQAEHDRVLEITRQNYENIKKTDVLKAMEKVIEENYILQHSKKHHENSMNSVKQSMLMQEMEGDEKLQKLLRVKDESRSVMVQQLLEDQDVQKAIVASLVERVDAKSWSLNEEIALISSNLAKLSLIEQEKKKLQVAYNYNELLHQRVQLVTLLDDLLDQQSVRRKQLTETLKEMESQAAEQSTDFWLKNYQKLLDSAPKSLLNVGKHLDPVLANFLLQEGVIHCLPFLVKFLFSEETISDITHEKLKQNGVLLLTDREGILRAVNDYISVKSKGYDNSENVSPSIDKTPSTADVPEKECVGVVSVDESQSAMESECVICMDSGCEVVFVPCGHMCCCQACSKDVEECPMCRSNIERKIKVIVA